MAVITTIALILTAALVKWVKDFEAERQEELDYQQWNQEMHSMWSVE
jgi:hypothetical protein